MMNGSTERITGELFAGLVRAGAEGLRAHRTVVNDLNVFPIPDGDTGDNMYMTAEAGAREAAAAAGTGAGLGDTAAAAAHGMLLGARGNSGVILSRIFAGIAEGLRDLPDADAASLAGAFGRGTTEAYAAVAHPVEGTMLTVWREAAAAAGEAAGRGAAAGGLFCALTEEMRASLERTPDLLDTLRDAGVVDSGGAGLVYLAEGMLDLLEGRAPQAAGTAADEKPAGAVDISAFGEDSVLEFGYCTEFLLRLQSSKVDPGSFREEEMFAHLREIGESVVAFRDGSVIRVHIHTMHPGEVLNYCQRFGEFLTLKIENMMLQHEETTVRNNYEPRAPKKPHKAYGVVTVASGKGIAETFRSLGVDEVIDGGQSMNPSAEDFIRAFREINADTILVFPNNGNVILTARQAAGLYGDAEIRVIGTHTVGEGYAALSMLDTSSGDTDAIAAELEEIAAGVVTGMVSRASRATEMDGFTIEKDDYIGFAGDVIYAASREREEAALGLCEALNAGRRDVLLLLCGEDADAAEADRLYARLSAVCPRTEVIMINGGQPVFDYILILE